MRSAHLALLKVGAKACKESMCGKPLYVDGLGMFYAND